MWYSLTPLHLCKEKKKDNANSYNTLLLMFIRWKKMSDFRASIPLLPTVRNENVSEKESILKSASQSPKFCQAVLAFSFINSRFKGDFFFFTFSKGPNKTVALFLLLCGSELSDMKLKGSKKGQGNYDWICNDALLTYLPGRPCLSKDSSVSLSLT